MPQGRTKETSTGKDRPLSPLSHMHNGTIWTWTIFWRSQVSNGTTSLTVQEHWVHKQMLNVPWYQHGRDQRSHIMYIRSLQHNKSKRTMYQLGRVKHIYPHMYIRSTNRCVTWKAFVDAQHNHVMYIRLRNKNTQTYNCTSDVTTKEMTPLDTR